MQRLTIARLFRFVREAGANRGAWVEAIQRVTGNGPGDAWCASFVAFVLTLAYNGRPPLPATASCQALLEYARAHQMIVGQPMPGDVYLLLDANGHAHHTGFVTDVAGANDDRFEEISGNTNPDGGREGYGVFERRGGRARVVSPATVFIRLPEEPLP